jgi:hypothetical protein
MPAVFRDSNAGGARRLQCLKLSPAEGSSGALWANFETRKSNPGFFQGQTDNIAA